MAISLPYEDVGGGCAVVLGDELHLLGSSTNLRKHYKWNGHEWSEVSSLPYDFCYTSAVVYNNEIHIIGSNSNSTDSTKHYKWNGTSWVSVSSLPFNFMLGSNACVYNNEIHIIALSYHYKWNGSSWVTASTPPYQLYTSVVIVYDNALHIIGGTATENRRKHYKWNGTTWTNVSTPPMDVYGGCTATVYNNELHILGGDGGATNHYKWNGTAWTSASTLPMSCRYNATATYHNCIHTMGSAYDSTGLLHYKWDGETWSQNDTEPEPEPEIELTVDDGYKNIRIRIDGNIVADQDIIDNITINYGCTDGSAPAFGTTFSPHCDVTIESNELIGIHALDNIVMGKIFIVECELSDGVYTPMGRFEINTPVQYTEDYLMSFSGDGMLGTVLDRKKMNWDNMSNYDTSKKGIITIPQALEMIHTQFPTIEILVNSNLLDEYEDAKIIVPLKLNKWKKGVAYKKQFVKITAREWIAGIAVMLQGNVIEYKNTISIVTLAEAYRNVGITEGKYFSGDSFMSDYLTERIPYAPKSLLLNTYETIPVTSKKKNGSKTTHGFCYGAECECGTSYNFIETAGESVNKYDVYVDCQWIGKSYETYYFNDGDINGKSGEFEDESSSLTSYVVFKFTPMSLDFSGWHSIFEPAHFIRVRTLKKNTATQEEIPVYVLAFISDMTFSWNGTITTQINSAYNGDSSSVTITIGSNDPVSSAWDNGTNIPEMAEVSIQDFDWFSINQLPFPLQPNNLPDRVLVFNNELLCFSSTNSICYTYSDRTNTWEQSNIAFPPEYNWAMCVYDGTIYTFSNNYGYRSPLCPYKWSNTTGQWEAVTAMRYPNEAISDGSYGRICGAVDYYGELHVLFGTRLFKWDGTNWTFVANCPADIWSLDWKDGLHIYNGRLIAQAGLRIYFFDEQYLYKPALGSPLRCTTVGAVYQDEIVNVEYRGRTSDYYFMKFLGGDYIKSDMTISNMEYSSYPNGYLRIIIEYGQYLHGFLTVNSSTSYHLIGKYKE